MIGVFWVVENRIFGACRDLQEGVELQPGILDSPDTHVDIWEQSAPFMPQFPYLRDQEYFSVPRGRVLYDRRGSRYLVYMDKCLFNKDSKDQVREFFGIEEALTITWRKDVHYTSSSSELDELFRE